MSIKLANLDHEVVYQELIALVRRHSNNLTPLEILAIAANMIGKLVALQDQRTTTREMAMETIIVNLEYGNKQALEQISGPAAGSA